LVLGVFIVGVRLVVEIGVDAQFFYNEVFEVFGDCLDFSHVFVYRFDVFGVGFGQVSPG
jgi:hypothetical protein